MEKIAVSHCAVEQVTTFESYNLDSDGRSSVRLINYRFTQDTIVENSYPPGLYISMLGQCQCQAINDNQRTDYNHQYVVALVEDLQSSQINFHANSFWQTFAIMLPLDKVNESAILSNLSKNFSVLTPGVKLAELGPVPSDILRCCEAAWDCNFDGFERELFIKAKAQEVLALFLHKRRKADTTTITSRMSQLNYALSHIQKNLGKEWSLSAVARLAGSNQTYVKVDMKQLVGSSFRDWLKVTRVEAACELLAGSDSMIQITQHIGFKSQAYFATFFKTELGITPSGYRQSLLIERSA